MMGLLQLLGIKPALREVKQSQATAVTMLLYAGQQVAWMTKDYATFAREGYMACQDAYACIEQIAKAIESLPIILFSGEGGKEKDVENHALLTLIGRPNPREGKSKFIGSFTRFLLIAGNSYIEAAGPTTGPPRELYILKPQRTSVLIGTAVDPIKGYRYRAAGGYQDFKPEEILHMRTFHPIDDYYGLAPIEVAARGIDISNLGMKWNAKLLANDMRPSGGFIFEKPLVGEQRTLFKQDVRDMQQGAENAGNFLILDGVKDFKQMSINAKEGDWTNLDKLTTRKICRVFGVAPEIIGDSSNKTYSNYQEARLALYVDTAIPLAMWILDELNTWLTPKFIQPGSAERLRLAIDIDNVDALQEQRDKAWTRMGGAWFLKFNEKRQACGFMPAKEPIGEMYHIPIGFIETDGSANGDGNGNGDGGTGDEGAAMGNKSRKASGLWGDVKKRKHLWLAFEQRVKAREKSFEPMAKGYLRPQADALRQKASQLDSMGSVLAADIFSVQEEAKRYAKTFNSWYIDHFIRAGNAGIQASKGELFDDAEFKSLAWKDDPKKPTSWVFEMTPEQVAKLKDMIFESGTKVNETMLETVEQMIRQANEENWTVAEFAKNLFDKVDDLIPSKARLWARTESVKVDNYGELEGYKETEFVEKKGWMCSFVPESRESHMAADGQEVALNEDFNVGGKAMAFPGDPKGGPENDCNCLCAQYPVVGD
jgi:HK97 family phage portal protein